MAILLIAFCRIPALAQGDAQFIIGSDGTIVKNEYQDMEYVLNPDDLVTVNVWRHPEISTSSNLGPGALGTAILVTPDGYISFPFLGRVKVQGMTLEELRLKIMESLRDIYRNPVVTVGLATRRKMRVYILGEVKNPGLYDMEKPEITVAEALTLAGGATTKAAVSRTTIRKGGETIPLNLEGLVYRGEEFTEVMVQPEDVLIIPEMRKRVALLGQVTRPGIYDIRDDNTLLDVLSLAGGFGDRAKLRNVAIFRRVHGKDEIIKVNTRDILDKKQAGKNIIMENGDIVYVDQLNNPKWQDIVNSALFLYYLKLLFPNMGK